MTSTTPGVALGRLYVERGDPPARDLADRENGVKHSGRMVVRREARFSLDLQDAFAAGQRLADIRAMPRMGGVSSKSDLRRHADTPDTDAKGEAGKKRRFAPAFRQQRA